MQDIYHEKYKINMIDAIMTSRSNMSYAVWFE